MGIVSVLKVAVILSNSLFSICSSFKISRHDVNNTFCRTQKRVKILKCEQPVLWWSGPIHSSRFASQKLTMNHLTYHNEQHCKNKLRFRSFIKKIQTKHSSIELHSSYWQNTHPRHRQYFNFFYWQYYAHSAFNRIGSIYRVIELEINYLCERFKWSYLNFDVYNRFKGKVGLFSSVYK